MGGRLKRSFLRNIKRKTKEIQDKQYELIKHEFVAQLACSAMYTGVYGPLEPEFTEAVAKRLEKELEVAQIADHRAYFDLIVRLAGDVSREMYPQEASDAATIL